MHKSVSFPFFNDKQKMELKYMPYVTHFPRDGSHAPFRTVMWVAASPIRRWG